MDMVNHGKDSRGSQIRLCEDQRANEWLERRYAQSCGGTRHAEELDVGASLDAHALPRKCHIVAAMLPG
jgi:hypothetical protein